MTAVLAVAAVLVAAPLAGPAASAASTKTIEGTTGDDRLQTGPNDIVRAGNGNDHVWSYYTTSDTVLDCGPGPRDVLHLHNDIRGERIVGCEDIEIRYAS